ncbi:DNA polymerase III subunit gamma/tau [Patescibacteria group bacterium]|nr:DNA polymerase III subunit gamma/tau [Patescibacteria group bacterium]
MYQALYRSFRPETFDGILGQEHIVRILKHQIAGETTGHAYLFCGTRGTGKTSTARILAKGVNCTAELSERPCGICDNCKNIKDGVFLDVIEIDAASNNGVDNIRELRESVKYPPVTGRRKVYIIDEVHMLSTGAFNALLKTLEEPPSHVMFILATTEPQKLPATILSRCLRLDFRRVSERDLKDGLREICKILGVKVSENALGLIAANADGSVRDALSLLDQCISAGQKEIVRKDILELLGTSGEETFIEMTDHVTGGEIPEALMLLDRILADGKDVRQFIKDWIAHYRGLLMTKFIEDPASILNASAENVERIRSQSTSMGVEAINTGIRDLSATFAEARWATQPRILLELCIVRMAGWGETAPARVDSPPQRGKPPKPAEPLEQKPQSKPRQKPAPEQPATSPGDADLWQQIFDDNGSTASFQILRKGGRLSEIDSNTFLLEVSNEIMLRCAKDHGAQLEEKIKDITGKARKIQCRIAEDWTEPGITVEEVASAIGSRLKTTVEII